MRIPPVRLAFLLAAFFPSFLPAADAPLPREIENEQILGINKEPPHATLMPFASMEEVLAGNRWASSYARSLNGDWSFHWVPRPEERPVDFYKLDYNVSGWKTIPVPSCWQMHGYGTPYYRNSGYIFQKDWPRVLTDPPKNYTAYEERDPVGSYRRDFEVPAEWKDRRIFITFNGVDSNLYLWINGQKVGYSVNSRAPAEFDITSYLKPGKNVLAAEVYRFCAGSYLEDQDMWRLSGIFRNVTLWSAPTVHIRDFFVQPDLDTDYRHSMVSITAKVKNFGDSPVAAGRTIDYKLYNREGERVIVVNSGARVPALAPGEEQTLTWKVVVENPRKWTAETPYLYTSLLLMRNPAGENSPEEYISCRTGFRKVEIKGDLFEINGVPVKLLGFNRHENEAETAHTITEEEMVRDIKLLKGCNSNHVRTCHYQDDPRWYELCDEYGLYLVAEANLESHGSGFTAATSLSYQTRWEKAHVQRQIDNVETLKNHASAVIWSLGNEAGSGPNFDAAYAAVKKIDGSRPVHYEGWRHGGDANKSDVISEMYTAPTRIEAALQEHKYTKPFYLCEYAHAMNNSMGGMKEYMDVFDKYPGAMGGAIWEWQDQAIWNRRDPAHPFLAYGGGFGEVPNDGVFILKGGGVFADRTINPKYVEAKYSYRWIRTRIVDGKLEIRNRYAFTNLSKYKAVWTLSSNGKIEERGELPALDLAPGASQTVDIPVSIKVGPAARSNSPVGMSRFASTSAPASALAAGTGTKDAEIDSEYFLKVSYQLKEDELWAKAGFEVAADQMEVPVSKGGEGTAASILVVPPKTKLDIGTGVDVSTGNANSANGSSGDIKFVQDEKQITVSGAAFQMVFDKTTGALSDLTYAGARIIAPDTGGLQLHAYRAPHLNDDLWANKDWQAAGLGRLERKASNVEATQVNPKTVRVQVACTAEGKGDFGFTQAVMYTVSADGSVAVESTVTPHGNRIVLPRLGARMLLDPALDHFTYLGRGPMENYPDRKLGSDIGLYGSTVKEQFTPYVRPMECGNHEDVRWCVLTRGADGPGIMVSSGAEHPLSVSALPYADEQIEKAPYAKDLTPSMATVLCLSAKTLGVGSGSCGPPTFPQYHVFSDPVTYSYTLRPVSAGTKDYSELSMR